MYCINDIIYHVLTIVFVLAGQSSLLIIKEAALRRLLHSLRPNSRLNYKSYFSAFITFVNAFDVDLSQLHHRYVISFIEWLVSSNLSHSTICNYISDVKYFSKIYALNDQAFEHPLVNKMLIACARTLPAKLDNKPVFTPQLMQLIIKSTVITSHPSAYSAFFSLIFHRFLHISNLLPTSQSAFNPL